ncbi:MAG: hypothetical protein Q8N84_02280, partial [bacterium]|nr:hypothetical protein [bacterium]
MATSNKFEGRVLTFGEWLAALPEMPAVEFCHHRCRPDFAFCGSNLLPQDQAEFESFRRSWHTRFGTLGVGELDSVRGRTNLDDRGWYALTAEAALVLM